MHNKENKFKKKKQIHLPARKNHKTIEKIGINEVKKYPMIYFNYNICVITGIKKNEPTEPRSSFSNDLDNEWRVIRIFRCAENKLA